MNIPRCRLCRRVRIGLEEIDDGVWNVYFGALKLGRLLERHLRIEDAYGRLKRHRYEQERRLRFAASPPKKRT